MSISDQDTLARLGFSAAPLLGSGNEAQVYELPQNRIARILRPGASLEEAEARAGLTREIAEHARHLHFETPKVESVGMLDGRVFAIEALLPGQPVSLVLTRIKGAARSALLEAYLETASLISTIALRRDFFGPVIGDADLRSPTWNGFLRARLERSLGLCPDDLREAVQRAAALDLPEPERPALVHLDYFPGNVLAERGKVGAVLDFGPSCIMGDARMEAWSAVAYLDPELSPAANDTDREQAVNWLARHNLIDHYPAAKAWLAAYWSFAADDAALMAWCRKTLLAQESRSLFRPFGR